MKLMTKTIEKSLPPLYANEEVEDPVVKVKFFCPWNQWTWFATEYDPQERRFYGLVRGNFEELGYFLLDELESVRGPRGLKIERDLYFKSQRISELTNFS